MRLFEFFESPVTQHLAEGGNVFKDEPHTIRIAQADVLPTVKWLEKVTGLPLTDNMLGSTGKKATSGDLDLAVDSTVVSKDDLAARLRAVADKMKLPATSVKKSGVSVHFRTPILGDNSKGHVQTDFMFTDDMNWMRYVMSADPRSKYSGANRAQFLAAVAKEMGFKVSPAAGLVSRTSDKTISKNPDEIAKILFGPDADRNSIASVETMLAALKKDTKEGAAKYAAVKQNFDKMGIELPPL